MITKQDKKVVDFFYNGKSLNGKLLKTNGKKLEKTGIGGQTIAKKVGNDFLIVAKMDSKSTESVVNYIKKSFPKDVIFNNKRDKKLAMRNLKSDFEQELMDYQKKYGKREEKENRQKRQIENMYFNIMVEKERRKKSKAKRRF